MAFQLEDDSKQFWIKGRKFSVRGLLGDETYSSGFDEGSFDWLHMTTIISMFLSMV